MRSQGHVSVALIPNTRTLDSSMPLPPFLVVEGQQVRGSVHHTLGNSSMMPKSQELSAARTEKSFRAAAGKWGGRG